VADRVELIAWSDYLCPWCYNAAVRLDRLEDDLDGRVHVEWRTFLLRPHPDPSRTLEKFRAYTESWLRPAAEPDAAPFRVWATEEDRRRTACRRTWWRRPPRSSARRVPRDARAPAARLLRREPRHHEGGDAAGALGEAGLPEAEFARSATTRCCATWSSSTTRRSRSA
jgi:hypothetical protein